MSIADTFHEHQAVLEASKALIEPLAAAVDLILTSFSRGGKVLACGNGGSAATAQHFVAELLGRFESPRNPLPAIALSNDLSTLTALANDFGYEEVFSRPLEALARPGDILVAISASGVSPSILRAAWKARELACYVVGLTGETGKELADISNAALVVPSNRTARIQEIHSLCLHAIIEAIEALCSQSS